MHKTTSFRDLNWGLLSQGLNIASGILLLPVVLVCLSKEEIGLWYVFSSLAGLAQLLELGFQPTIARYVAYIYAGAQRLEKSGISSSTANDQMNLLLLGQVFQASKSIYLRITLIVSATLLGACPLYIISLLTPATSWQNVIIAWVLFALGYIANFYYGYYNGFLQGRGDITASNQVIVVTRLILICVGSVLLFCGFGLVGLGLASLLSAVISRVLLHRLFWHNKLPEVSYLKAIPTATYDNNTSSVLWHNALKLGWVFLGAFLITRMNILIASSFLGLAAAANYGLTFQIFITLSALASTLYSVKLPSLNAEQIRGRADKILEMFGQALATSWVFFIVVSLVLILFGNKLLAAIGGHARLLDSKLLIFFAVIMFLEMNQSLCSSYLTTLNEIVFVRAALISGFAIVITSILLVSIFHLGVWGLLLSQGIIQLGYNSWKWPKEAARKMGCSYYYVLHRGFAAIYTFMFLRRTRS